VAIRQALRAMIEKDLVAVEPDPANRRRRIVTITNRVRYRLDLADERLRLSG
jgi:DNA-binding MarR family transcriptional regulator